MPLIQKIIRAKKNKSLTVGAYRYLYHLLYANISAIVNYPLKYKRYKAIPSLKKGVRDHRVKAVIDDARYMAIFKRLADAYNKAKVKQANIDEPYQVGGSWGLGLDTNCRELTAALRNNDTVKLQALLENFNRERFSSGAGAEYLDYRMLKSTPLYKYQFVNTWYKYYNIYKDVTDDNPQLSYPLLGNPVGLYYDGQIIPIDSFRYMYYATEILSLLRDVENPVICEIGGGVGGQAYKVLSSSHRNLTYILLDIPEILTISSYFLMAALPEKKFLLYEEDLFDSSRLKCYDVILMPNFMLPYLGDETVDLFFNSCSFSEMNSATVEEYIHQTERICKRYFMHINHGVKFVWYARDGKKTENVTASQIRPDPRRFKRIYKHPRVFGRLQDKLYQKDFYTFLYERLSPGSVETQKSG